MTSVTESKQFNNIGAVTTAAFGLKGGKYAIIWAATLGGGNLQLQALAGDGVTWVPVGSAVAALGLSNYDLPPGQYRFVITTSTANYISITSVPY